MNVKTLFIAGMLISAVTVSASVITTDSNQATAYTVSSTDLLETSATGFTDTLVWKYTDPGSPTFLADGDGDLIATANVHIQTGTITYDLDTVAGPQGYAINSIDTYSGSIGYNRNDQEYIVKYSTVADPGTFITITNIVKNGTSGLYEKWSITDTSGILATGVAKIQFDFPATQQFDGVGYWELDVMGTALITATDTNQNTAFTISTTDLLQTSVESIADTLDWKWTSDSASILSDGTMNGFPVHDSRHIEGGTVTYTLVGSSSLGYDINSIESFSAHVDANRMDQLYTVSYSTVAAPEIFIEIASISMNGGGVGIFENHEKWTITQDQTGILATGVKKIRFDFGDGTTQQNDGVGYWELDVFGTYNPQGTIISVQ